MTNLRLWRESQDPGDPRRADVHLNFEGTAADGRTRRTGWVATVHPEFVALLTAAPDLADALECALRESGCDGDLCAYAWHEHARAALRKAGRKT